MKAEWFNAPCLDLRDSDAFQHFHIKKTTSLPWARLPMAMHELPDKNCILQLLGTQKQLDEAREFLTSKGYQISREMLANDNFWQWAQENQLVESGCHSIPLWQANPLLQEQIADIESTTSGRTALDLACGAGRDAVFMAQRGWQVTTLDVKADALSRAQDLAASSQVELSTIQADIEAHPESLGESQYDLIIVMRFLFRPLLSRLIKHLKPGGIICYSTFMQGCEKFGSPRNPNYLLKPGELAEVYAALNVLTDEVRHLPDGRPVALFVAQKPD